MSLFIIGTDTGVGKTHIAARLLRLLRASGTEALADIAALTNADIPKRILSVPLLAELGETLTELPVEWQLMLGLTKEHSAS